MNRDDIRLNNVRTLIQAVGSIAKFAELVGMSSSQVSQFAGRKPTRKIGNAVAARIERAFTKPSGWLDYREEVQEPSTAGPTDGKETRPNSSRVQTILDLTASLSTGEQDELI